MPEFAPIALFTYNRPVHTRQTLEALSKNELAGESILYVFSDGPKNGASNDELRKISEVRNIIKEKRNFKEIIIIESETNKGLATSVINGVTEVVSKHQKVIVLEDDLITAKGFLKFMNEGLERYVADENVFQVSGQCFNADIPARNGCFFMPMVTSIGWATWKRAWEKFDPNARGYEVMKTDKALEQKFNLDGAYPYAQMLYKQMETSEIDSWAIRWWWSVFNHNGISLYADKSLVYNIGFDAEGTHSKDTKGYSFYNSPLFDKDYFIFNFPDKISINEEFFLKIKSYIYKSLAKNKVVENASISSIFAKFLKVFLNR